MAAVKPAALVMYQGHDVLARVFSWLDTVGPCTGLTLILGGSVAVKLFGVVDAIAAAAAEAGVHVGLATKNKVIKPTTARSLRMICVNYYTITEMLDPAPAVRTATL